MIASGKVEWGKWFGWIWIDTQIDKEGVLWGYNNSVWGLIQQVDAK